MPMSAGFGQESHPPPAGALLTRFMEAPLITLERPLVVQALLELSLNFTMIIIG